MFKKYTRKPEIRYQLEKREEQQQQKKHFKVLEWKTFEGELN